MKCVIAGSRGITNYNDLFYFLYVNNLIDRITEVVSGRAAGVDTLGEQFAAFYKKELTFFPANWKLHGKSAGMKRNIEMADYCDFAVILWDGKSSGTRGMINQIEEREKELFLLKVIDPDNYLNLII